MSNDRALSVASTWTPRQTLAAAVLLLLMAASLILVAFQNPGLVRFWPFTAAEFVQLITPLFLIALLIERVVEVLITASRGEGAGLARRSDDEAAAIAYKAGTQRLAFIFGVTLGVIVSAVGVRVLGLIVDPAVFDQLPTLQQRVFNTADVILTGALIGGGAEALHHLVSVFTNFMKSSAENLKPSDA